jgi:hypothetical protein
MHGTGKGFNQKGTLQLQYYFKLAFYKREQPEKKFDL